MELLVNNNLVPNKFLPGKLYQLRRAYGDHRFWVGDYMKPIVREGEKTDFAVFPIPNASILMYLGLVDNDNMHRAAYLFLYGEKLVLCNKEDVDQNKASSFHAVETATEHI